MTYEPNDAALKRLVKRFAGSRRVCNCGWAWMVWDPESPYAIYHGATKELTWHKGQHVCQYGCQSAQLQTEFELVRELEKMIES